VCVQSAVLKTLTAVDPNPHMIDIARGHLTAKTGGDNAPGVTAALIQGRAEELEFSSGSFDAVVTTLVLCSVTDAKKSMAEIARVLKPGGRWLFMEHVRSEESQMLAMLQDALDPLEGIFAEGCHLNRPTNRQILRSNHFARVEPYEEFSAMGDRGEQFLIGPHAMGVAWKAAASA